MSINPKYRQGKRKLENLTTIPNQQWAKVFNSEVASTKALV